MTVEKHSTIKQKFVNVHLELVGMVMDVLRSIPACMEPNGTIFSLPVNALLELIGMEHIAIDQQTAKEVNT